MDPQIRTHDDDLMVVTFTDGSTRPYDETELAARLARIESADLRASVKELIGELNSHIDKAQAVIDTPNATINASPVAYIKDLARALKRDSPPPKTSPD